MQIRQILLIDDDPDDWDIFCMALSQVDPSIYCHKTSNGLEATEYLLSDKPLPDVIFLDVNMPLMNGMEFMKWRIQNPTYLHIPVIVYTTTANQLTASVMKELGAAQFITKPEALDEVIKTLKHVVRYFIP